MAQNLRTLHLVTTDSALADAAQGAVSTIDGWQVKPLEDGRVLAKELPQPGELVLVDAVSDRGRPYELVRFLTGQTRCRIFLVVDGENDLASPIARFCGAAGVIDLPFSSEGLAGAIASLEPEKPLPHEVRGIVGSDDLPMRLLEDLEGEFKVPGLMRALVDSETGLFNYAFLGYKLDEEFKRAKRFDDPLACVMLGFEGQADQDVLHKLAGIFLQSSRDTDILGRFDENSFLFLLPKTGPDGASVMAERVTEQAAEMKLKDLVGDRLEIAVGISCYPDAAIARRDDLFGRARDAFLSARSDGGGVVVAP